jgi:hypothetical protein
MKKSLLITTTIALFSISLFAGAVIKFKQTTIDFGEIDSGKVADLQFEFENAGDSLLEIKNIRSTCGCTVAKLDKKEYQAGEKGSIPVKFFSKGYRGRVTKSITVSSNDKDNVYTVLKITGVVTLKDFAQAEINPDRLNFKEVTLREKYPQTLTIKNSGTIDLRIIEVTHSPEITTEFSHKIIKPQAEAALKIVLSPMEKGKFTSFIKIRTNAYRQYITIVKVEAEVSE